MFDTDINGKQHITLFVSFQINIYGIKQYQHEMNKETIEQLLDTYLNREIECIYQSIDMWNDAILLSLRNEILPIIYKKSTYEYYNTMVVEAEKMYSDELHRQAERKKHFSKETEQEYWQYDDVLRMLYYNKEDIRERMEEPFEEILSEWRTKRVKVLEQTTTLDQRPSVCIAYAYCKNNTNLYLSRVKLYQETRNEYETTGKAYPSLEWLLTCEKELFPWGFPDKQVNSIQGLFTKGLDIMVENIK